jgi:hypothetical protein
MDKCRFEIGQPGEVFLMGQTGKDASLMGQIGEDVSLLVHGRGYVSGADWRRCVLTDLLESKCQWGRLERMCPYWCTGQGMSLMEQTGEDAFLLVHWRGYVLNGADWRGYVLNGADWRGCILNAEDRKVVSRLGKTRENIDRIRTVDGPNIIDTQQGTKNENGEYMSIIELTGIFKIYPF